MERSSSILQGRNRTHSIRSHETEDEEDLLQQGLDFDQQDQDKAQLRENIRFRTTSEQDKELEQRRDGDEEMNLNPFGLSPLESLTRNGSELENLNRKENQSLNFGKEELEKLIERKMGPRVGSRAGTGFSSRSGSGKTLSPIDFNSKPTSRMSNLDFNDGLNDLRSTWENTKGDQGNGMAYIRKIRQDEDLFSPTSQSQEYEKEDLNSTLSLWKNQSHLKSLLTGSTSNGGSFSKESESQPIAADFGQDFFDDDDDDEDTEFGDEVGDNRAESSSRGSRNMIPRSLTPTRLFAGAGTQAMVSGFRLLSVFLIDFSPLLTSLLWLSSFSISLIRLKQSVFYLVRQLQHQTRGRFPTLQTPESTRSTSRLRLSPGYIPNLQISWLCHLHQFPLRCSKLEGVAQRTLLSWD